MADYAALLTGIRLEVDVKGVIASSKQVNKAFDMTYEKMQKQITSSGYLLLSLKRIATYTGIFSFFGGLTRLVAGAIETERRFAEVSTLVSSSNVAMTKSLQSVIAEMTTLDSHLGSTADLAKGLYEIMSAGFLDPAEGLKILKVSAEYAKGGMTDLSTSAAALTSVLKAYGMTADETGRVSNALFQSVREGKYHVEDLNAALGNVLPTAAIMGVSIEEVGAALATLSNRGLSASEAATALNRLLLSFLKPGRGAIEVFDRLGIEYGINALQARGLVGALDDLRRAMVSGDQALQKLVQRESGMRAVFTMATQGYQEYKDTLERETQAVIDDTVRHEAYQKVVATTSEELKAMGVSFQKAMNEQMKYSGSLNVLIKALNWFGTNAILNIKQLGILATAWLGVRTALGSVSKKYEEAQKFIATGTAQIEKNNNFVINATSLMKKQEENIIRLTYAKFQDAQTDEQRIAVLKAYDTEMGKLPAKYAEATRNAMAYNEAMAIKLTRMQRVMTTMQRWMGILSMTLFYLQLFVIAYQLISSVIRSFLNRLKEQDKAIKESTDLIKKKTEELKLLIAVTKEYNNVEVEYDKGKVEQRAIENVISSIRRLSQGDVIKKYQDAVKKGLIDPMAEAYRRLPALTGAEPTSPSAYALMANKVKQEHLTMIAAVAKGAPVLEKDRALFLALAQAGGEWVKAIEDTKKQFTDADVILRVFSNNLTRAKTWYGEFSKTYIEHTTSTMLANMKQKDEIKNVVDVFNEINKVMEEVATGKASAGTLGKMKMIEDAFKEAGISIEQLSRDIKENLPIWQQAFKTWDAEAFRRKVKEFVTEGKAGIDEITLSLEQFKIVVAGLPQMWEIWKEETGGEDMKAFVGMDMARGYLEKLDNVWNKFSDDLKKRAPEDYELIKRLLEVFNKDKTAAKAQAALETAFEKFDTIITKAYGDTAQIMDEFYDQGYMKVVDRVNKQNELDKQALDKQLKNLKEHHANSFIAWLKYLMALQALQERYRAATLLADKDYFMALAESQARMIDSATAGQADKINLAVAMANKMQEQVKGSVKDLEAQAVILQALDKFWMEYIAKLKEGYTNLTQLIDGLSLAHRMLSTLATSLRDLVDALGVDSNSGFAKAAEVVETFAKGIQSAIAALKTLEALNTARKLAEAAGEAENFANKLARVATVADLVITVVTTVVSVFMKIFGIKTKAQKEAERLARLVKEIQRDLSGLGNVTEETAKQIAELSKKVGKLRAELYSLDDVLNDTGLNLINFAKYIYKVTQLLGYTSKTSKYFTQQTEAANNVVSELINFMIEMGEEGTRSFLKLVAYARKYGLQIKSLNDYIYGWLEKGIAGIQKLIDGVDLSAITSDISVFSDINEDIEQFAKSAKTVATYFGETFGNLVDVVVELGLEGNAVFVNLIKKTRLLGLNVKEVSEYVYGWLGKSIEGLNAMLNRVSFGVFEDVYEGMKKNEEELKKYQDELAIAMAAFEPVDKINEKIAELTAAIALAQFQLGSMSDEMKAEFLPTMQRAGNLILSTFNAFISQGKTASEAFAEIIEPLNTLRERYEMLGEEADESLQMLFNLADLYAVNEGMIASIDGVRQVLNALGNTGFLTSQNLQDVAADAMDMFNQLQEAGLSQQEAFMFIAPTLADLVYYAEQYGFALDEGTLALIAQAQELGVYRERQQTLSETMTEGFEAVVDSLDKILDSLRGVFGSIDDYLDDFDISTVTDELRELYGPQLQTAANMLLATFNGLMTQGKDYLEALLMIKDPLMALREKYEALGLTASDAMEAMFAITDVITENEDLLESINGLRQGFLALGNTGFLTQELLLDVGVQAQDFYNRLLDAGIGQQQALAIISPMLADMVYYANQYGYELDYNTLALIAQAQEMGVFHERSQDLLDVLQEGFNNLSILLYGLPDAMGRVWKSIMDGTYVAGRAWDGFNAGGNMAIATAYDVAKAISTLPDINYEQGSPPIRSAAIGMPEVGRTELIRVHKGESILPENISAALRGFFQGSSRPSMPESGGMAEVTIEIDGMKFYKATVPYFKKGMRNTDIEVSGEGVF